MGCTIGSKVCVSKRARESTILGGGGRGLAPRVARCGIMVEDDTDDRGGVDTETARILLSPGL